MRGREREKIIEVFKKQEKRIVRSRRSSSSFFNVPRSPLSYSYFFIFSIESIKNIF